MLVPAFILQLHLNGKFDKEQNLPKAQVSMFTTAQRDTIFWLGVGGLCFVPVFRYLTNLPPFMGILLVLGVLWTVTEIFHRSVHRENEEDTMAKRVTDLLSRIDLSTIMFFLGILMAVACLEHVGVLTALGSWLDNVSGGNHYLVTGIIGVLSSIVDNVPLVAGAMGMYPVAATGDMAVDGIFWQLLAYCAGVGGSMLIIGSAAGVVVMGLEKITFGWYMKKITWIAFVGYLCGMFCYWLEKMIF
jgi:Na+/H+ antiporter NhaD/arsenite permease-like protein